MSLFPLELNVGARGSTLSQAQVEEVLAELLGHHPHVRFKPLWFTTTGDKDQTTSLRTMGPCDFFTKEIDDALLEGRCRIAIHSAKDLPKPLRAGISMVALTKGVDSSDSLVFRGGEDIYRLKSGAIVATSSARREDMVKAVRSDLTFCDIRGNIEARLKKLQEGLCDALVVAEAALIRLKLTQLSRMSLPGETAEFQGQLAVLAVDDDSDMQELFSSIDVR